MLSTGKTLALFCRICNPTANKISGFTIRLIWFLLYRITNPYNNCVWIANPDELSGKAGSTGKTLSPFCRICNPTANKISGFTIRLIWFLFYWITNPYNNCVWIANPDELREDWEGWETLIIILNS